MRRLLLILLSLSLVAAVHASYDRAALVIQTVGDNRFEVEGKSDRIRTLQVLPEEATISVPRGCTLRLSYFANGRKETITGPVKLSVRQLGSAVIGGNGKIVRRSARGVKEVIGEKNLRRMGGAMQAKATQTPAEMLAMVQFEEPGGGQSRSRKTAATRQVALAATVKTSPPVESNSMDIELVEDSGAEQSSAAPPAPPAWEPDVKYRKGPLRPVGLPPTFVAPPPERVLAWNGGPQSGEYEVVLMRGEEKTMVNKTQSERYLRCGPTVLSPGRFYTLKVKHLESNQSFTSEFYILNKKEAEKYQEGFKEMKSELSYDDSTPHAEMISWMEENGLLLEARRELESAVKRFAGNAGFHAGLARVFINLGMYQEARDQLDKVSQLEGH